MRDLIEKYLSAKAAEQMAIDTRVAIGNEIAEKLGTPAEGSATHEVDGYKVTVKQPVNRRVDWDAFDRVTDGWEPQHLPITTKRELDAKGLRWVKENLPGAYEKLARAITATPGRIAVEIKENK